MKLRLVVIGAVAALVVLTAVIALSTPEAKGEEVAQRVTGIAERHGLVPATPAQIEEVAFGMDRVLCAFATTAVDDEVWDELGRAYADLFDVDKPSVSELQYFIEAGSGTGTYREIEDGKYRVTVRLLLAVGATGAEPRAKFAYIDVTTNRPAVGGFWGWLKRITHSTAVSSSRPHPSSYSLRSFTALPFDFIFRFSISTTTENAIAKYV